ERILARCGGITRRRITLLTPLATDLIRMISLDPGKGGNARRTAFLGGALDEWSEAAHAARAVARGTQADDETRELPDDSRARKPQTAGAGFIQQAPERWSAGAGLRRGGIEG